MKPSRKHHYIPRFYLKGFTNEQNSFYVYDKINKKMWLSNPDSSFAENHRNTGVIENYETKEIHKSDLPEAFLANFDGRSAKVLYEILSSKPQDSILTTERLHALRFFVISTFWRIPANDALRNKIVKEFDFKDLGFGIFDEEGIRKEEQEELFKTLDIWGKFYPVLLTTAAIRKPNNETDFNAWRICYRESKMHIVTDNPIILKEFSGFGSLQKDLIMPLSSKHLLLVAKDVKVKELPPVFNLQTDLLLYHNAERYVASSSDGSGRMILT